MLYQGLPYVPKIILTELLGHHDKGTLASRRRENLLPGNAMKTCSCYGYLPWARKNYQLKRHESRLGRDYLCHGKATSYDSIFFIVGLHDEPMQIPIKASGLAGVFISPDLIVSDQDFVSTSKSWSPGTTFELDCGYNLRVSCKDINSRPDYLPTKLCMADLFPPNL